MQRILRVLTLFVITCFVLHSVHPVPLTAAPYTDDNAVQDVALRKLVDEFWEWRLREFPERATGIGFHQYDDRLESYAVVALNRRKDDCLNFRRRASSINATSLDDQLTLSVLIDQLDTFVDGHKWIFYGWLTPLNFLEGFQRHTGWINAALFRTENDYNKYLHRLTALPLQIEEVINLLDLAVQRRVTNHAISMQNVVSELREMGQCAVQKSVFYEPYNIRLELLQLPTETKLNIRSQGIRVITERVQPAFIRIANYVEQRYLPSTRSDYGVHALPNGTQYYNVLLRWYLSVDLTAAKLHDIGLSEVERIRGKMTNIARRQGFNGSLLQFFDHLRDDSRHYNHTEDQYLELFKKAIYDRILPHLGSHFSNLTDLPVLQIKQTATDGIVAMYYPDTLLTNTRRPHTRPSFAVMVLALHEGVPGHHLQVSITKQQILPEFRRSILGGRKFAAPYDFPYYTSNVEGWALYAEFLGEELGLYKDDFELFSRYSYEIFRASRLVVDTGIHALGWSREQAIEFMGNTFLTRREVEIEIDRYITWPGQACAYKVGEMKLLELRHRAETSLGAKFDVRSFHMAVLRIGAVSLGLLDVYVDHWITSQLAASLPASLASGIHQTFSASSLAAVAVAFIACRMRLLTETYSGSPTN